MLKVYKNLMHPDNPRVPDNERPEPTLKANLQALMRFSITKQHELKPDYTKMIIPTIVGTGLGAGAGFALTKFIPKLHKTKTPIVTTAAGLISGLTYGYGRARDLKPHMEEAGFKSVSSSKIIELSNDAKLKYLSSKYKGGGYNG